MITNIKHLCYVLKIDIRGYFMSIDKDILFNKLNQLIIHNYDRDDKYLLIELCRIIIYNDPTFGGG